MSQNVQIQSAHQNDISKFFISAKEKFKNRTLLGSSPKGTLQFKNHPDMISQYSYIENLARVEGTFDQ